MVDIIYLRKTDWRSVELPAVKDFSSWWYKNDQANLMTKCTKARATHGSEKGITGEEIQSSIITYVKQVQTVTSAHTDVKADSFQEC